MTNTKTAKTDSASLRDTAKGLHINSVNAMVRKIEESFDRRDAFEESQGLSLESANSYTVERDRMLTNNDTAKNCEAVARTFLALGLEPSAVIERKVSENSMFNAKALKKVTEISRFVWSGADIPEKVIRSFLCSAIVVTRRGSETMNNTLNQQFLNGRDLSSIIKDQKTLDEINALSGDSSRHTAMTTGNATQSSQMRNVLDVLGIGAIRTTAKPRDAIALNADHAFVTLFAERYLK